MIYLQVFWAFLKIGMFSFGGAYAAIPLMRDVVLSYGWMSEDSLSYFIAVSESTPGPVMVNLATYVGSKTAGIFGAAVATLGVILPAFIIMLIVARLMKKFLENRAIASVISGITPAVVGLILGTGIWMSAQSLGVVTGESIFKLPDWRSVVICAILLITMAIYKKVRKKSFSPILLIIASAVLGIILYSF